MQAMECNIPDLQQRLNFLDGSQRKQSTSLLLVGSVMGLLGFVFAAFLGFWKSIKETPDEDFAGRQMNYSYFPATVSEMVYDPNSPQGHVFFAFVIIGAICMLLSWYPWKLQNVYIGDDELVPFTGIPVLMLRQFLPALGMMLVACIPAKPAANRAFTDKVCAIIHTCGAVGAIGGYAFIELFTLTIWREKVKFNESGSELWVRTVLVGLCLMSIGIFQGCGVLLSQGESYICCNDIWRIPTEEDVNAVSSKDPGQALLDQIAMAQNVKLVFQTASGPFLVLKILEYWGEVLAGVFMLASHLAIWYFSWERDIDLLERMPTCGTMESTAEEVTEGYRPLPAGQAV